MSNIIAAVLAGLFSLAAVAYTVWSGQRAKHTQDAVEKVRADGESYERAQGIYRQIVADLQAEVARLKEALREVQEQLRTEENRSADLDTKVDALQWSVNRMSALLSEANIPLPIREVS